jgi:hypothetical protein
MAPIEKSGFFTRVIRGQKLAQQGNQALFEERDDEMSDRGNRKRHGHKWRPNTVR